MLSSKKIRYFEVLSAEAFAECTKLFFVTWREHEFAFNDFTSTRTYSLDVEVILKEFFLCS